MQLFSYTGPAWRKQCSACFHFSSCLLLPCFLPSCRIALVCPMAKTKQMPLPCAIARCCNNVSAQPAQHACIQHLYVLRLPKAVLSHSWQASPSSIVMSASSKWLAVSELDLLWHTIANFAT